MSTIVGTNIEVTNIKFDSDTTSMIISNAGQVTVQGENTATTNLQQGLCKWWIKYSQDAGSGSQNLDSFNVSSVTDVETGRFDPTYSSNMNNANYCVSVMHQAELTNADSTEYTVGQATNTTQLRTVENGVLRDKGNANASAVGDLA